MESSLTQTKLKSEAESIQNANKKLLTEAIAANTGAKKDAKTQDKVNVLTAWVALGTATLHNDWNTKQPW